MAKAGEHFARSHSVSSALLAFYRGDLAAATRLLQPPFDVDRLDTAPLLVALGRLEEAEAIRRKLVANPNDSVYSRLLEGQIELARGESARGTATLEAVLPKARGTVGAWLACEALARAYWSQGKLKQAERILQHGPADPFGTAGPAYRMRGQLQLAAIERELGHMKEVQRVEAELRKELAFADPDHPILRELEGRGSLIQSLFTPPASQEGFGTGGGVRPISVMAQPLLAATRHHHPNSASWPRQHQTPRWRRSTIH